MLRGCCKERVENITHYIGTTPFSAAIHYMERRTLSLKIVSKNDSFYLEIKAPLQLNSDEVTTFIRRKERWLMGRVALISKRNTTSPPREYVDGEKHLLLGEEFTLRVVPIKGKSIATTYENNILTIFPRYGQSNELLVKMWYATISAKTFAPIITPIATAFMLRYGLSYRSIEYKYVRSYWGQCTSSKHIRLNIELLRAPIECIEYIMAHELCHLKHHNHSDKFYALLSDFMPDWRERKSLLNQTISIDR